MGNDIRDLKIWNLSCPCSPQPNPGDWPGICQDDPLHVLKSNILIILLFIVLFINTRTENGKLNCHTRPDSGGLLGHGVAGAWGSSPGSRPGPVASEPGVSRTSPSADTDHRGQPISHQDTEGRDEVWEQQRPHEGLERCEPQRGAEEGAAGAHVLHHSHGERHQVVGHRQRAQSPRGERNIHRHYTSFVIWSHYLSSDPPAVREGVWPAGDSWRQGQGGGVQHPVLAGRERLI